MKALLQKIRRILKDRRTRQMLTRIISVTAAVVVFVTTYALVLPAITMETEAQCGIEAHQHSDECYTDELVCEIPESLGHLHTDACYELSQVLVCEKPEHEHSVENGCYDEDGNLICELAEHHHAVNDGCYKEVKELVCDIPESEGHTHDSSCYKKVLTCGKEVHTHSTACYHIDAASRAATESAAVASTESAAIAGTDSMMSTKASTGSEVTAFTDNLPDGEIDESNIGTIGAATSTDLENVVTTSADADAAGTDLGGESGTWIPAEEIVDSALSETDGGAEGSTASAASSSTTSSISSISSTASTTEKATEENAGYVPVLDELNINAVLNDHTGIYYYHPESDFATDSNEASTESSDGPVPADNNDNNVAEDTNDDTANVVIDGTAIPSEDWHRIPNNTEDGEITELGESDLLRVYLAYTIPAGSLNETNTVTRYRLPANIRLSDDQIDAINSTVNGIAAQYVNMDTLEVLDVDQYNASLGIEAVEGTRTPDQDIQDYLNDLEKSGEEASEYINATVRIETVFNEDSGDYEGQDLVFAFTPYSILKNQHEYDKDGQPTRAGEELQGWVSLDLTTDQIEWIATGSGDDNNAKEAVEKTASIVFVERDKELGIDEISTELKLVEKATVNDIPTEKAEGVDAVDTGESTKINETDAAREEEKEDNKAGATEDDEIAEIENAVEEPAVSYPSVSFDDSITVTSCSLSTDTLGARAEENTEITVHVEADADTFPEGTTMRLAAVTDDQMDAVTEAVEGAMAEAAGAEGTSGRTQGFHALDISFWNADGVEIEPLKPIRVSMTSEAIKRAVEDSATAPVVVHVEDGHAADTGNSVEKNATSEGSIAESADDNQDAATSSDSETVDNPESGLQTLPTASIIETETGETKEENTDTLIFEAGAFSVYAIVYTVDFHWEVDGKEYSYSIIGGSAITLSELLLNIGVISTNESTEVDEVKVFLEDVNNVTFSSPELVEVIKVSEDTTIEQIKIKRGLESQYSAEMTEEQISEINSTSVNSGDWVLISMQPFDSDEELNVIMENGDQFIVKVTDALVRAGNLWELNGNEYALAVNVNYQDVMLTSETHNNGGRLVAEEVNFNRLTSVPTKWKFTSINNTSYGQFYISCGNNQYLNINGESVTVSSNRQALTVEVVDDNRIRISQNNYAVNLYNHDAANGFGGYSFVYDWNERFRLYDAPEDTEFLVKVSPEAGGTVAGRYSDGAPTGNIKSFYSRVKSGMYYAGYNNNTIKASNSEGYLFDHWELDGSDTGIKNSTISAPGLSSNGLYIGEDGGHVLTAVFKKVDITITQNDIEMGHVSYMNSGITYATSHDTDSLEVGISASGTAKNTITASPSNEERYRFVHWVASDDSKVTSWGDGCTAESNQIKPIVSDNVTITAVFEELPDYTTPPDYGDDAEVLIKRLKDEMEAEGAVLTKTAHVVDEENRIYEVDLSSSSHRKVLGYGMTLAFITDVSRSMYFPANLDEANIDSLSLSTSAGNNVYGFKTWLDNQQVKTTINLGEGKTGTYIKYGGKNVYYMIGDVNGTATLLAIFWYGNEWCVADASYFDDLRMGRTVDIDSRINKPISTYLKYEQASDGRYYYHLNPGTKYKLDDRTGTKPNIYLAYTTSDNDASYTTRLDYLQKAVKIASDVVYGVNDSAQVGLVTFAKGSYNHPQTDQTYVRSKYTSEQSEQFKNAVNNISLYGGTRQDFGLDSAENSGWFQSSDQTKFPQVAILVTDGAPNITINNALVANNTAWNDYVTPEANGLKAKGVELFTLGLSLDRVGTNKQSLYKIAGNSGDNPGTWNSSAGVWSGIDAKYQKNAETGEDIVETLMEIIQSMELNGNLLGSVTDTIDAAFYPLDGNGDPIEEGVYIETNNGISKIGEITELLNDNGTPKQGTQIYSSDNTKKYSVWKKVGNQWQVTWYNQNINKEQNSSPGWSQSFLVKAREDFLGGNTLNTNAGNAAITADRFTVDEYPDSVPGTFDEPVTQSASTPRVNVVELGLDQHDTEWDIYLGSDVDAVEELKALYEEIKVQERVTHSDSEHRIDGDTVVPGNNSETYSLLDKIELEDDDWDALLEGESVTIPYNDYGHQDIGTITVSLVKNESDDVAGTDTYSLKVSYTPTPADTDIDYKTTPGGSPGREASSIVSNNEHVIDEYYLPTSFRIKKTDGSGNAITDSPAMFKLYRKTKDGDPGIAVPLSRYDPDNTDPYLHPQGDETEDPLFTTIDTAHTMNGVANIGGLVDELGNNKDEALLMNASDGPYYLIESGAPMGYSRSRTPVKIEVVAGPNFYTDLEGNPITLPEGQTTPTGLYNMTQGVTIKINGEVAALYDAGGNPVTLPGGRDYLLEEDKDKGYYWRTTITNDSLTAETAVRQGQILPHKKTIDYLGDAQDNPDTTVDNNVVDSEEKTNAINDLYRLYLNAKLFNTVTNANIILVEDYSTSMDTYTIGEKTRYELVRDVLKGDENNVGFIDTVLAEDSGNKLSVIKFSDPWTHVLRNGQTDQGSEVLVNWTDDAEMAIDGIDHDYPDADISITHTVRLNSGVERTVSNAYGTNYELAFNMIQAQIDAIRQDSERQDYPTYVIFISDGLPTSYVNNLGDEVTAYDNMINIPEGLTRDKIDDQENVENLNWVLGTSIDAVSSFKNGQDNIQICTVGLGAQMNTIMTEATIGHSDPATGADFYYENFNYDFILRDLASTDPTNSSLKLYRQVTSKSLLQNALNYFVKTPDITKVMISDEMSDYVNLHANQLDLAVTKTSLSGSRTNLNVAYDSSAKNYRVTDNGTEVGRIIIDGKTISLDFKDNLNYSTSDTYTLSFNVKATTEAYEEYVENLQEDGNNGYDTVAGDKKTDYVSVNDDGDIMYSNDTSSEKAGFHSNKTATVEYTYKGDDESENYDNPVIQVGKTELEIQKTWKKVTPEDIDEVTIKVLKDGDQTFTVTLEKAKGWKTTLENLVPKKLVETEDDSNVKDKDGNALKKTKYVPYIYTLEEDMEPADATVAAILQGYKVTYSFTATESEDNTSFTNITSKYENGHLIYFIPAKDMTSASDKGKAEITNTYRGQDVVLRKIGVNNNDQTHTQNALGNAKFTIYKYSGNDNSPKADVVVVDNRRLANLISDSTKDGEFWSGMLPGGTYIIEEIETPDGYNRPTVIIKMKIDTDGVAMSYIGTIGDPNNLYNNPQVSGDVWTISLVNIAGVELPASGGSGSTIIYFLGLMFIVLGCLGFVRMYLLPQTTSRL